MLALWEEFIDFMSSSNAASESASSEHNTSLDQSMSSVSSKHTVGLKKKKNHQLQIRTFIYL